MNPVRYKMVIAYRGTNYHGWQFQEAAPNWKGAPPIEGRGIPTVQEIVAHELAGVLGHPVSLVGSSRTDAGVHAKGQLAHFDTPMVQVPPLGMMRAVNHRLPADILIRSIEPAEPDFHSIRWAARKRYQYFIWNAEQRPLFFADLAWHRRHELDIAAMTDAAQRLVGERDFASFAKPGHGRMSTVRTLHDCCVQARGPRVIIGVEGDGFLWHMVRIIVGTLVQVGLGQFAPGEIDAMLAARDRRAAGLTAPPHGLYLHWVKSWEREQALIAGAAPEAMENSDSE